MLLSLLLLLFLEALASATAALRDVNYFRSCVAAVVVIVGELRVLLIVIVLLLLVLSLL